MSRFYITTPIYYINAEPHLGHAYTTMIADCVARAHRLMGDDVFFLTGTDEHGQKVERAAQKAGIPTKAFADHTSEKFRALSGLLNISNDDFIRTTEPRHFRAAQELWRRVKERGYIYKGKYEGWYCTVDEVFVPETQLVDGRCPTCGGKVERIAEESYFFKLSAFEDRLRTYYAEHPDFVTPPNRRNEVVAFIETGLQDLSVSRTSFKWGIPVPDDPAHVMYVWFDALTNYMTAVGYGDPTPAGTEMFEQFWPANVHLIGKEIVRQHGIYWPAFLMAAELPVPERLVSHGWWMMDGAKMSKSIGNVVHPKDYVDRFGVDAFRYFVMREMVFGHDADFTDDAFLGRYNADLANDLGNLVSRATTMIHRYCGGAVPKPGQAGEREIGVQKQLLELIPKVKAHLTRFELSFALKEVWDAIGAVNRYIVANEPWKLAKQPDRREQLHTTLYLIADGLRVIGELLRPFIPSSAERALAMIGVRPAPNSWQDLTLDQLDPGTQLGETSALFPRIEQTVEELRRMASEEQQTQAPAATTATPAASGPAESARIAIDDFMKIELRVAKVLSAERVPKSNKLIKLQVDVGSEQRQLVAGIAEAYEPEALVGRTVVIVFNLKPAKLMGIESNGMVLAASPEGGAPTLVGFDVPPPPGTRVR